jgi:hypothetical protein
MSIPRPPKGAGPSGRRVWRAVLGEFELEEHERALVTALVRQVDRLDELEALIAAEGLMVSGHGTVKMHPAVIEARQSSPAARVRPGGPVRRRKRPGSPVPEQLARFIPGEWPGGCPHEALDMWKDAAADWLAADSARARRPGADAESNRWWLAGGSRRRLPFGGALGLLREEIAYRRDMPACPGEYRPAVHWVNGPPSEV